MKKINIKSYKMQIILPAVVYGIILIFLLLSGEYFMSEILFFTVVITHATVLFFQYKYQKDYADYFLYNETEFGFERNKQILTFEYNNVKEISFYCTTVPGCWALRRGELYFDITILQEDNTSVVIKITDRKLYWILPVLLERKIPFYSTQKDVNNYLLNLLKNTPESREKTQTIIITIFVIYIFLLTLLFYLKGMQYF